MTARDQRDPGGKHSKRSIPASTTELILAEVGATDAPMAGVLVLLEDRSRTNRRKEPR